MLNDCVNIFEVGRPRKALLLDLFENPLQTIDDPFAIAWADDALPGQHSGVRETAANVIQRDAAVELK